MPRRKASRSDALGAPGRGPGGDALAGRGRSQRQLRVGEELRHRLAVVFERGELSDPALDGVALTVTEVKVSPDLTNATAFVTPLGGEKLDDVVKALNRAAGFLRHRVSDDLGLRVSPRLSFAPDHSFEEASRVEAILRHPKVAADLAKDVETDESDADESGAAEPGDGDDGKA